MENLYILNDIPNHQFILEAAEDKESHPAFIEKDWYAVQVLKSLGNFTNDRGIELVFSGGTSLSKGDDIIKRFSEDLDFVLRSKEPVKEGARRNFRRAVIAHITADERFDIDPDKVQRGDSNRFFKAQIQYPREFGHDSLRPDVQIEMTFFNPRLPVAMQDIRSIISEMSGGEPETQMTCVSPIETASDKVSALTWRVLVRDRSARNDDPTMVRHLHDLAALKDKILGDRETFIDCARQSLEHDKSRRRGGDAIAGMRISDRMEKAVEQLSNDKEYQTEYQIFVDRMSYADNSERIAFDDALSGFREFTKLISQAT